MATRRCRSGAFVYKEGRRDVHHAAQVSICSVLSRLAVDGFKNVLIDKTADKAVVELQDCSNLGLEGAIAVATIAAPVFQTL